MIAKEIAPGAEARRVPRLTRKSLCRRRKAGNGSSTSTTAIPPAAARAQRLGERLYVRLKGQGGRRTLALPDFEISQNLARGLIAHIRVALQTFADDVAQRLRNGVVEI